MKIDIYRFINTAVADNFMLMFLHRSLSPAKFKTHRKLGAFTVNVSFLKILKCAPVCSQAVKSDYEQGLCQRKTGRLESEKEKRFQKGGQRETLEGGAQLALKVGDRAVSLGMQAASRSQKRQGNRGRQLFQYLEF